MQPLKFGIGQSVVRKEDDPLLRGRGRYVADTAVRGTLHAVVLRSPHAHAGFRIDAAKARAMPGVRLVLTGADTAELGPLPCTVAFPDATVDVPPYPILPRDEVRHVGDAIAFVVADTLDRAKDAAEAIAVDWQPLPHVIGIAAALEAGRAAGLAAAAAAISPSTIALGDQAATARAFAQAAKDRGADARQSASGQPITSIPAASSPNTMRQTTA